MNFTLTNTVWSKEQDRFAVLDCFRLEKLFDLFFPLLCDLGYKKKFVYFYSKYQTDNTTTKKNLICNLWGRDVLFLLDLCFLITSFLCFFVVVFFLHFFLYTFFVQLKFLNPMTNSISLLVLIFSFKLVKKWICLSIVRTVVFWCIQLYTLIMYTLYTPVCWHRKAYSFSFVIKLNVSF